MSLYRWGCLVVDTYREFWVPLKLYQGKMLYKDVFYLFGILPPHLSALLFKLFGVHIYPIAAFGLAVAVGTTLFMYRIARWYMSRFLSTLMVVNFLYVFAFGAYMYSGGQNFILPYSPASTLCIMCLLAALYFFMGYLKEDKATGIFYWTLFMVLAALSRVEHALAAWMVFAFFGVVRFVLERKHPLRIVLLCAPLVITLLVYSIFFVATGSFGAYKETALAYLAGVATKRLSFQYATSGLDHIADNTVSVLLSFAFHLGVGLVFYSIDAWGYRRKEKKLSYGEAAAAGIVAAFLMANLLPYTLQYACTPLFLLWGAGASFYRALKGRWRESLPGALICLLSLLLLGRIILKVSPFHYGFYLMAAGLIGYYLFFADFYPAFLDHVRGCGASGRAYYVTALALFFVACSFPYVKLNYLIYQDKTFRVHTEMGTVESFNDRVSSRFWDAVVYLRDHTPQEARLVVVPEGVGINFFSFRDNPTPYYSVIPDELILAGEEKVLAAYKTAGIDYVAMLNRDTSEFGPGKFGGDYGLLLWEWITRDFELVAQFGPLPEKSSEFGIAVYKKKPSTKSP